MADERERATNEEAIRAELAKSVGPVLYSDLAAHLKRDAVVVVAPSLSLVECGVAVARDDVAAIGRWIESGDLRKPSLEERREWAASTDRTWSVIVVQPYVLLQDPGD